ncbi:MAG: hypothetical protein QXL34_06330 [Thermosphaera sp.]
MSIVLLMSCNAPLPSDQLTFSNTTLTPNPTDKSALSQSKQLLSAFESYEIAKIASYDWDEKSVLYKIPATFIMEKNLGFPITGEGWFFMFKSPVTTLEYYVYIWNGKVSGTTEAQPIYIGEPKVDIIPIDIYSLLDSKDVENIINNHISIEGKKLNFELVHYKKDSYPTWVVYDLSNSQDIPVAIINAITGEIIYDDK